MKIRKILFVLLIFFLVICCLPPLVLVVSSVSANWIYPSILPNDMTFSNIKYVFSNGEVFEAIYTTFLICVLSSLFCVFISFLTARVIVFYDFVGKKLIKVLVLLPLVVPSVTVVSTAHIFMIRTGIEGTIFGVSLIHCFFAIPYGVKILENHFLSVGDKYEVMSSNLGASEVYTLFKVTLPLALSPLCFVFFISATVSISQYITTLIIGGGSIKTLSTLLVPYVQYGEYEIASIYSLILILMSVVLYKILDRKGGRDV